LEQLIQGFIKIIQKTFTSIYQYGLQWMTLKGKINLNYNFSNHLTCLNYVNSYHGKNERISIRNYNNMINFYFNLVKNTDNLGFETENNLHIEL